MNPRIVERLIRVADDNKIPYQMAAESRATGTDANAMQVNRAGMATGLVSVANRYMHSPVEMISLEDIDHSADLLAEFALSIDVESDFVP
jgi:endoglucanase